MPAITMPVMLTQRRALAFLQLADLTNLSQRPAVYLRPVMRLSDLKGLRAKHPGAPPKAIHGRAVSPRRGGSLVEPVIDVRDLVKRYADLTAVDGISFHVDPGEMFSLLGPN